MYNWIVVNKELIKIFYALIVVFICAVIVIKTDRLFRLSLHNGIRYFRNAFFFFGVGFIFRYFLNVFPSYPVNKIVFEFFMIMAGCFLLYSLLWKRIESFGRDYHSSLFNPYVLIFYLISFIIVFVDYLWSTYYGMFGSQIVLFSFASIISYINYQRNRTRPFLKFYFIAMILSLTAWLLNAGASLLLNWNQGILIASYLLNIIIFLVFLFGVVRVTAR